MKLSFSYDKALISKKELDTTLARLRPEIARLAKITRHNNPASSLVLPSDDVSRIDQVIAWHKGAGLIVVVGIGGSNLGTQAVAEATLGRRQSAHGRPRILFAETVDASTLAYITGEMRSAARNSERITLNAISKSGSTTETVANAEILLATLAKLDPAWRERVVVTTGKNSPLWELAGKEGFTVLQIPGTVEGRYSVLSAVGLFPLGVLGLDTKALRKGAAGVLAETFSSKNDAVLASAALAYLHAKKGRAINDLFLFSPDLESVGRWWRQLLAESCGKEWDAKHEKRIFAGITPTVSIGSTDLHSVGQLSLGGPHDKFTTFVTVKKEREVRVPKMPAYDALVSHLQGKSAHAILDAIYQGTAAAYEKHKRPHCLITLPDRSAYAIGELLQFKMLETMLIAKLLGVNPFDQPNVESYKEVTREILAGKKK